MLCVAGCRISIEAHDQFFFSEFKRLRNLIRDLHPDRRHFTLLSWNRRHEPVRKVNFLLKPNGISHFLNARRTMKEFLQRELQWYKQYNLQPPIAIREEQQEDSSQETPAKPERIATCWCGKKFRANKPIDPSMSCCRTHGIILRRSKELKIKPQTLWKRRTKEVPMREKGL